MIAEAETTGDWILQLDADEEVTPALAAEIRRCINADPETAYFRIPIENYVGDRLIRYGWGCAFGTTSAARLFRRGVKTWRLERVHPGFEIDGAQGRPLDCAIVHRVDTNIADMLARFERYTALRAIDLRSAGVKPSLRTIPGTAWQAIARFFKCYVRRKGYREGDWGILIALLAALYPMVSLLRARLEPSAGEGG